MAATHWHPGARSIAPRWTFPVALLPAESVTSWLVRTALRHGCDPPTLTLWLWPGWRFWALDGDRGIPEERLAALSSVSGVPEEALRAATILPVASRLQGEPLNASSSWPWTLTIGARNMRRNGGIQFCPTCLKEDDTPYFRLPWRFAWHVGCTTHQTTILDRCPACSAVVTPHRLPADTAHCAVCATCTADLKDAETEPCQPEALAFQKAAKQVALEGFGDCFGETWDAPTWFAAADFLVALIRRANRSPTQSLNYLLRSNGVVIPQHIPPIPGARVERLRAQDRRDLLAGAWRLMRLDTRQLRAALKASGITRQGWCEKGQSLPEPLARFIPELPESPDRRPYSPRKLRTGGPRPRHEVVLMMERLRRKLELQAQ